MWWTKGEIRTKNPDAHTILKLIEVAKTLGARVRGDDDEIYSLEGEVACPCCEAEMRDAIERIRSSARDTQDELPGGTASCGGCGKSIRLQVEGIVAGGVQIWAAQW